MAVENDDDRAAFFDPDDFGGIATVTLADGTHFDVAGIYDGPHLVRGVKQDNQFSYATAADASGQKPTFRTRTAILPGVKNGRSTILIGDPFFTPATLFSIHDVQPDGTGLTILRLLKA